MFQVEPNDVIACLRNQFDIHPGRIPADYPEEKRVSIKQFAYAIGYWKQCSFPSLEKDE